MPSPSPVAALDKALSTLLAERRTHAAALAQIDAVLAKYGIDPKRVPGAAPRAVSSAASKAPARVAAKPAPSFKPVQTATEFVLSLLADGKAPTSAELAAAWRDSGRAGKVSQVLSTLVGEKKVKRTPVPGGRGSTYALV